MVLLLCTLDLACLHSTIGHVDEAKVATKEAIHTSKLMRDSACLCYAIEWFSQLWMVIPGYMVWMKL